MKIIKTSSKKDGSRGISKRQVVFPKTNLNDNDKLQNFIQTLTNVPNGIAKDVSKDQTQDNAKVVTNTKTTICWYTVYIKTSNTVTNSSIMLAVGWILRPLKVTPYNFQRIDNNCQFFLDNHLVAQLLMRLVHVFAEQYISEPLEVRVVPGLPSDDMNPKITLELVNGIKSALKANYDASNQCLDLTTFHTKLPTLFCPLHVVKLMRCVLQLIPRETPMVKKIILKNNNICSLMAFRCITYGYPQIDTLDISANDIKNFDDLPMLAQLHINTLILTGNFTGLNEMEKILPKTTIIFSGNEDDQDNQPTDIIKSPTSPPLVKTDQNSNAIEMEFFSQFHQIYYSLFDKCDKRSGLGEYYATDAMFSLSVSDELLDVDAYNYYDHDQCSTQISSTARSRKLKVGGSDIMKALNRFPEIQTQHQDSTLSILMYTDNWRAFAIRGTFLESSESGWTKRQFQRTFVLNLLPTGSWLISNDMLSITEPPKIEPIKFEEKSSDTNEPNKNKKDINFDIINENMKQLLLTNSQESIAGQSSLRTPNPNMSDGIYDLDDDDSLDLGIDINENIFQCEEENL